MSCLLACLVTTAVAQVDERIVAQFEGGVSKVGERRYPYRLLRPLAEHRDTPQPLVVFLHGAGERGDDNKQQLRWLPEQFVQPEWRRRWPCYVLAVQCQSNERWVDASWRVVEGPPIARQPTRALRAVQQVVAELVAYEGIDRGRVYLTGMSMGGLGTWDLVMRDPQTYAAALPVCGGGDARQAQRLIGLPIEIWHGANDREISVDRAREMVDALAKLGFPPRYRELGDVGHDVWKQAYADDGALTWLFAQDQRQQVRGTFAEPAIVPRPDVIEARDGTFKLKSSARVHAPEAARAMTAYLLDALELPAVRRPGFVRDVQPAPGDLVVTLDAELDHVYVIDVRDRITLTARDVPALRQGCAALYQALKTWPDLSMPRGTFMHDRRPKNLRLELGWTRFRWQRDALRRLHRECFLGCVQEVSFGQDGKLPTGSEDWRSFLAQAHTLGVRVVAGADEPASADFVATEADSYGDVLRRTVAAGVEDPQFVLRLSGDAPDVVMRRMQRLLPAVVERANHVSRPVHVSSFVTRIAARWR